MCARLPARTLPLSVGSYAFLSYASTDQRRSPTRQPINAEVLMQWLRRALSERTVLRVPQRRRRYTLYYDIY